MSFVKSKNKLHEFCPMHFAIQHNPRSGVEREEKRGYREPLGWEKSRERGRERAIEGERGWEIGGGGGGVEGEVGYM